MIKMIGGSLILFAAGSIGFSMAAQVDRQRKMLEDFHSALLWIRSEVQCSRPPLPELCGLLGESLPARTGKLFLCIASGLTDGLRIRQAFSQALRQYRVPPEPARIWEELAELFSRFDAVQLDRMLDASICKMEQLCRRAQGSSAQSIRLCRSLGVCLGGLLVILLL